MEKIVYSAIVHSALFSELPDDVGRECLLRASFKTHETLKKVCKTWNKLINSERYYQDRRMSGKSEVRVCIMHAQGMQGNKGGDRLFAPEYGISTVDPVTGVWGNLPPVPGFEEDGMPLFSQCVSVKRKLIMIGGWHPSTWTAMSSVFVFDFLTSKWLRGTDMPTVRSFFACASSDKDGLVYIAGGHDENKNALKSVEVYHPDTDTWESLPVMCEERDECAGAFADGHFVVVSGYSTDSQGTFTSNAELYCPKTSTWRIVDDVWLQRGSPRGRVASNEGLLIFAGRELLKCAAGENEWSGVEKLPESAGEEVGWVTGSGEKVTVCCESGRDGMCFLKTRGGDVTAWQCIERPKEHRGHVQCAVIVEI